MAVKRYRRKGTWLASGDVNVCRIGCLRCGRLLRGHGLLMWCPCSPGLAQHDISASIYARICSCGTAWIGLDSVEDGHLAVDGLAVVECACGRPWKEVGYGPIGALMVTLLRIGRTILTWLRVWDPGGLK